MYKMLKVTGCVTLTLIAWPKNVPAETIYAQVIQSANDYDVVMTIHTDKGNKNVPVTWSALPPESMTREFIAKNRSITMERGPTYGNKFTISSEDGKTFNVTGHSHIPAPITDLRYGIDQRAWASWSVDSTTISPTATTSLTIKMASSAEIIPRDPTSPNWEALSFAEVVDPIAFPALPPGESMDLGTNLLAGQVLKGTGDGVASRRIFVGTDIPGYETLYQLDVEAKEVNATPTLSVDFVSHSDMGLDDLAIANSVFNSFAFDPVEQQFVLESDLKVYDGPLPIPPNTAFNLHLDLIGSAEVTRPVVIPPPIDTVIMSPIAISENGLGSEFGTPLENMIDRSGFVDPFVSGETSFKNFVEDDSKNLATTRSGQFNWNFWSSPLLASGEPGDAELILDFGQQQTFTGVAVWNLTLGDLDLCVSDTPDGPCDDVESFTLETKTGLESAVRPDVLTFQQHQTGRYMRVAVNSLYRPDDNSPWIAVANEFAVSVLLPDEQLLGDFNLNGELDVGDIDLLTEHIRDSGSDKIFDVNLDGDVDGLDLDVWVRDLKNTYFGDANLDGEFGSGDLVDVFAAGKYEDGGNATWDEGDFNGDGFFESGDLVKAFIDGGYENGPRVDVNAVPEPASIILIIAGLIGITIHRRSVS